MPNYAMNQISVQGDPTGTVITREPIDFDEKRVFLLKAKPFQTLRANP